MATTMTPREHVEYIRKTKFSIGDKVNPLTEDLHQAVKNLSGELYAKDVHFFMELVQNAEDNEYAQGVDPSLEFVITSRDITGTGAPATLLVFNNEKGFSPKNIDSICSVGRSTKKGNRKCGYIGEKGIGFKSVFLITAQPYIFSNGYQIRFNEEPCSQCNVGYIVPEWVEQNPTLADIQKIYGAAGTVPTTTFVLPLKLDKVEAVKKQLSIIHPEVLLFLSKIKRLSVREDKEDPRQNNVTAIEIASQTDFVSRKNINAQSYTLHLSAEENEGNGECTYYMWKQTFPVKPQFRVEKRMEVDEWVITLAFPYGERLRRAMNSSPGVYAYLPTEMITNFPFIIQADFLLASSRETILLENKWNQGILDCVPFAFLHAFNYLVKTVESAPASSLPPMFRFLPIQASSYKELNVVRDSIKGIMIEEDIVPVEPVMEQRFFHKPREVGRLVPAFWTILKRARDQGVSMVKLSSHGKFVLSYSFDCEEYDPILSFLGVEPVCDDWYIKCIQGISDLVEGVSEDAYLQLLLFIADYWSSKFRVTNINHIPLIKCGNSLSSISKIKNGESKACMSSNVSHVSWLIECNQEFSSVSRFLFMPKATQEAISACSRKEALKKWLEDKVGVSSVTVNKYATDLVDSLNNRSIVVAYVRFLYLSLNNKSLTSGQVEVLCKTMPLVDSYGNVIKKRSGVIVPAKGSKWAGLTESNLWRNDGYVELGDHYNAGHFASKYISQKNILEFLAVLTAASDVPNIPAPSEVISSVFSRLTKQNAILLLDWIHHLRLNRWLMPQRFLNCIKQGSWMRVTLNGSVNYKPPSESFLLTSSWGTTLQDGSVSVDIPLIDKSFYGEDIADYKEELKIIGVMTEFSQACEFIGDHFMFLAASSSLTRGNVFSILRFIRFLRAKLLSPADFISAIRNGNWLKTSLGYMSPVGSVLSDTKWNVASRISNIPFIDQDFYGAEICSFRTELELLGVAISFDSSYQLIIDNLKSPSCIPSWTAEVVLLMLECMSLSRSSSKLVNAMKGANCLKTSIGYKSPEGCLLFHNGWGCILQVVTGLPVIDHNFYGGNIFSYRDELKKIGVAVDFEEASKIFAQYFKLYASKSSITKDNVVSLLRCYRTLEGTSYKFPADLRSCIDEAKWLRTRLGVYRSPRECILFSPEWEAISAITLLPFVDDSEIHYGSSIHEYRKELKSLGVVVDYKEGVKFVFSSLCLPKDATRISPVNTLVLLECVRIMQEKVKGHTFDPESDFMKKVNRAWIKTYAGYKSPKESLLFDDKFGTYLNQTDGPFIDEEFYDAKMATYRKELSALGVVVESEKGCSLLSGHLHTHHEKEGFARVYSYLHAFNWEPKSDAERWIWIPKKESVRPDECVIYDKDELFGLQLNVLEKHYKHKLLPFFSNAFGVKFNPTLDDYLKIWKVWESSNSSLSNAECCKFWSYVSKHWGSRTEKALAEALVKVPVNAGSDGIMLRDKCDVFIGDDLQLKYLFEQSSVESVFVWYPRSGLPSIPRTKWIEMYQKVGVRTISESVQKEELSLADEVQVETFPREKLIKKPLLKLILGFLAAPAMEMEAEKRRKAVDGLLNVTVVETAEPIAVRYSLSLTDGRVLIVEGSRKMRFDNANSEIFIEKMDKSGGQKSCIEFATIFSEAISENVLWESSEHMDSLAELIKVAALLEFDEEAVDYLMKVKNLETFTEDDEFLKTV